MANADDADGFEFLRTLTLWPVLTVNESLSSTVNPELELELTPPMMAAALMLAFENAHIPMAVKVPVDVTFLPIMSPAFDQVAVELVPVMTPVAVKAAQFKVPVNVGVALRTFRPVPVVSIAPVPPNTFANVPVVMPVAFRFVSPSPLPRILFPMMSPAFDQVASDLLPTRLYPTTVSFAPTAR
jgi:hypothetical protein